LAEATEDLSSKGKELPESISLEEALDLIQRLADAEIWSDRIRSMCEEEGITDPDEIEGAMHAWQNDMDDLISYEETLCDLVVEARKILGRDVSNIVE